MDNYKISVASMIDLCVDRPYVDLIRSDASKLTTKKVVRQLGTYAKSKYSYYLKKLF